jgi:hypothetical protein
LVAILTAGFFAIASTHFPHFPGFPEFGFFADDIGEEISVASPLLTIAW